MSDYRRQSHLAAVVRGADVSPCSLHVLEVLCRFSSFDRPEVSLSVDQVVRVTRRNRRTVQRALACLREAGVLEGVSGGNGGSQTRSYRLCVAAKAGSRSVRDELIRSCEAAGRVGAALWLAKVSAELRDGCLYISGDGLPVGQLRDQHQAAIELAASGVGASAVEFYVANGGRLRSTV